jgi:hypothetical protein
VQIVLTLHFVALTSMFRRVVMLAVDLTSNIVESAVMSMTSVRTVFKISVF